MREFFTQKLVFQKTSKIETSNQRCIDVNNATYTYKIRRPTNFMTYTNISTDKLG